MIVRDSRDSNRFLGSGLSASGLSHLTDEHIYYFRHLFREKHITNKYFSSQ